MNLALAWHRRPRKLPQKVRGYLAAEFNLPALYLDDLRCVERQGWFAGFPATYIKVFNPGQAGQKGISVRGLEDLEAHPELVLYEGHIESDGSIYIDAPRLGTGTARF